MKNTKKAFLSGLVIIILGFIVLVAIRLFTPEDTWIKDKRGVWVKHGTPKETPAEVAEQQKLIDIALEKYYILKNSGADLSAGPCLGLIADDWVADIAHDPRKDVDNLPQNQCSEYRQGKVKHFIELSEQGEIIKIQ